MRRFYVPHFAASQTLLLMSLVTIAAIAGLTGCTKSAPITKYEAPKETPAKVDAGEAKQARTLAAMVAQDDRVWFFKIQGPDEGVAKQTEAFETFVTSLDFSSGQPNWKLPEGWKEGQGSGMRFATINTGQPGIDVSVISLPAPQEELANANRWRGELQLKDWTKEEAAEAKKEIKIGDEVATVFNIAGTLPAGGRRPPFMGGGGAAPFAGGGGGNTELPAGHPPIAGGPNDVATDAPTDGPSSGANPFPRPGFEYTAPDGWKFGTARAMRKLVFDVTNADGKAEFTVIPLGLGASELTSNVNRWRGEVGLGEVDDAAAAKDMTEIKVGDTDAKLFEFVGEKEATSVVMAIRDERVWFFKLRGDAKAVASEKSNFLQLIESIKFPG